MKSTIQPKRDNSVLYPNYHIAPEHRSILLQPFDNILSNQGHTHLKRIAAIYFSQVIPNITPAFKLEGINIEHDRLILNPMLLTYRSKPTSAPTRFTGVIDGLQNIVQNSKTNRLNIQIQNGQLPAHQKDVSLEIYNDIHENYFNLIEITPDDHRKLTGKADSYKKQVFMMLEYVRLNNDNTVEIKFSPFMQSIREHLVRQIKNNNSKPFSDPEIIPVDINELKHFRSAYAIQLYLRIAKEQFYSNRLIINVAELAKYLGWLTNKRKFDKKKFFKTLKEIINDPGLSKSTCAILPINISNGKSKNLWVVAKRENRAITHIELRFKNNDELQQMLLDQPYAFIRHIQDSDLNRATLIQIIKRVFDDIIEESYVNYCVNKAYLYLEKDTKRSKEFEGRGIGRLVWDYLKSGSYREEYLYKEDLWLLDQPIGISITRYKKEQIQPRLPISNTAPKVNQVSEEENSFWKYIDDLLGVAGKPFFDYAYSTLAYESLRKRLKINGDASQSVKTLVLNDFYGAYKVQLIEYIKSTGFTDKHANVIYKLMSDSSKEALFTFYSNGRIDFPDDDNWTEIFRKDFKQCLELNFD